jgi:hypothetical protein
MQQPSGYVETDCGAVVRAMKSTYKRNGTLNLFAALETASGQDDDQTTEQYMFLDNYYTHKKNGEWVAKYAGRAQFHYTTKSANWIEQVEIRFGLLTRKALRSAIEACAAKTNDHLKPFHGRKREAKGSPLRNTIYCLIRQLSANYENLPFSAGSLVGCKQ